ncbi:MAG: Gfo/Idh/MocA family oxidoreductase [Clostridia bacterium]|nr:Gfo/Idh/MocA family oxidoreductase [Clostridia bacterium]
MKTQKIAVVGYGQRGSIYANYALQKPEEFVVTAIVDNDPDRLDLAKSLHTCPTFSDYKDFLAAGIEADIVAVATQDKDHREHAIACMAAGYDLLLEKPIATSLEDCEAIYEASVKYGRKIIVCHVLRYTPFYSKLKEVVDSGVLGEIVTMNTTECVGYYHQAHSFVRGPWRNSYEACPMILAKCCHDMDMIRYILGKKCLSVSSFGGLTHFTGNNAPEGSADYCSDCGCTDCVYKAQTIYEREEFFRGYFTTDVSNEGNWREKLVHSPYDRCVYKCDNDVVDHQVCIFEFENGVTVSHTMNAFSKEIYRDIKIHGTKAELVGNMEALYLELRPFGSDVVRYDFSDANTSGNHGGGDISMMHSLYLERNGKPAPGITYIDVSIDSHRMSFGAEKSRLTGKVVKI